MNTDNTIDQVSETNNVSDEVVVEQIMNPPSNMEPMNMEPQLQRQPVVEEQYIYAAGILRPHFPSQGLEKECEAAARILNVEPRDYYAIFSHKDSQGYPLYRYIAEQVSWILSIDNNDTYVVLPNGHDELSEFIYTLKRNETKTLTDDILSVVIGLKGPMAPEELNIDLPLPMVICKHIYSFTSEDMLAELNKNVNTTSTYIRNVLDALLTKPNIGASDIGRARNFIAYRYSTIYIDTSSADSGNQSAAEDKEYLESMEAKPSSGSPGRSVIDLIFTYKKNVSGRTNSYYVSVDVTDQFPFLHSDLKDYIPTN